VAAQAAVRPSLALGQRRPVALLGVVPFLAFTTLFLLVPAGAVLLGAVRDGSGHLTGHYVNEILQAQYLAAFRTSIELSFVTALGGVVAGGLLAWASVRDGTPQVVRAIVTSFSGVAANFAGVPLAFAFIATLGTIGVVTRWLGDLGFNPYEHGFTLFDFTGLSITYLYFQIPLMLLVISPALDGLRTEWREAAESLGASTTRYWVHVALPVLVPSFLGAFLLLFGNAFSAYATAYALTGGGVNIVPLLIGAVLNGNVLSDPHLGKALALGMVVVMTATVVLYGLLTRRTSRWAR
jgi:putative spermidine/putrescine transport system permease protein